MTEEDAIAALGRVIEERRETIEQRWLERVQRDVAHVPGASLTQLRDGLPDYLEALSGLLRSGKSLAQLSKDASVTDAWAEVARGHGITRVQLGFDIAQLIHEFIVLRQVLRQTAEEHGISSPSAEVALSDLLDAGVEVAVQAYVDARDFESRRRQAEHVGFLTHELRSPLSAAMLSAVELRRHATSAQAPMLDRLDRNHRKLQELIDGVLLTEKLEAGKIAPRRSSVKLGELLDSALEPARLAAAAKHLAFRASFDPQRVVELDPELTRSAVQNIVDNAVRYTDQGIVEITVDDRRTELVVHVHDSCHGISDEELRTIFEPFERGRTRKSGTGLGLAIARRAVEAQGGAIGAESPGPVGCHFWLRVPTEQAIRG